MGPLPLTERDCPPALLMEGVTCLLAPLAFTKMHTSNLCFQDLRGRELFSISGKVIYQVCIVSRMASSLLIFCAKSQQILNL